MHCSVFAGEFLHPRSDSALEPLILFQSVLCSHYEYESWILLISFQIFFAVCYYGQTNSCLTENLSLGFTSKIPVLLRLG